MFRKLSVLVVFLCVNSQKLSLNSCSLPAFPEHGRYVFSSQGTESIRPGDEVVQFTILRYSCDTGYQISDVISVCGETKTWSREPYCKQLQNGIAIEPSSLPDLTSCTLPTMPDHGNYSLLGDLVVENRPGDKVAQHTILRYRCAPGYSSKDSVSVCKTGSWTTKPTCKADSGSAASSPGLAGENGCKLPNYPKNGNYIINRMPNIRPGLLVDQFKYMSYSCNEGFDISGPGLVECNEKNQWSPIPTCNEKCHMPTSYSVDFVCRSGMNEIIDCVDAVPHGTEIQSGCKQEFTQIYDLYHIVCQEGKWNEYPPTCKATCGLDKPVGVELIVNPNIVTKHALPWHVGVYLVKSDGKVEHICGGSILYSNVIVSAAHCFFYDKGPIGAEYFKIAAGKFYRSYDNALDDAKYWVQKRDVAQIYLPPAYRGSESRHQSDIALVHLSIPLEFSGSVRPICFDLNNPALNAYQLRPGTMGKVAGWGLTESGDTSEELRVLNMPVIDINKCEDEVAKYKFLGFLTSDKLCAGFTTGSSVCQGDSGGGLVFPERRQYSDREVWHLRALVSVAPVETNLGTNRTTCRFDTYSAFTEVYKHKEWIIKILRMLKLLTSS